MGSSLRPYNGWTAAHYRNMSATPSTLNRRVDIWKRVATKNELGQTTYDDKNDMLLRTVWAQVLPQSGSMTWQQTETILTDVTHSVTVRYQSAKDVGVGDYLKYKGRRFNIRYMNTPDESNWMTVFYCEEVQDT